MGNIILKKANKRELNYLVKLICCVLIVSIIFRLSLAIYSRYVIVELAIYLPILITSLWLLIRSDKDKTIQFKIKPSHIHIVCVVLFVMLYLLSNFLLLVWIGNAPFGLQPEQLGAFASSIYYTFLIITTMLGILSIIMSIRHSIRYFTNLIHTTGLTFMILTCLANTKWMTTLDEFRVNMLRTIIPYLEALIIIFLFHIFIQKKYKEE